MQLLEIFLHSWRLKLECAYRASLLIELVCSGVVNGNIVEVNIYAPALLYYLDSLFLLGESLQSEEVHLDKSSRLYDMSVILCDSRLHVREVWVVGCRDWDMVRYRVTADDESACMYTSIAHCALKHFGVFDGVPLPGVARCLSILQLSDTLYGIGEIHLKAIWQAVGYGTAQGICIG